MAGFALAAFAAFAASATDDYTFIVSGDPAAVAVAGSSSCATDGTSFALLTGTITSSAENEADFDVRDWTLFETLGIKLNTRPWRGSLFIIR